jgi:SAM-dependent methyltransferase
MYAVGFTPWDGTQIPEPLRDLIDGPDGAEPGAALDLGCGNGRNAIYLAQRGWRVTGIDFVPKAIRTARARAAAAGVDVRLIQGDVTRLDENVGTDRFQLLFDFGCFHGLDDRQRASYAAGLNAHADDRATLLLMGFSEPLPPVARGVTQVELERRLGPDWRTDWTGLDSSADQTAAMRRAAPAWFLMRRTGIKPS